jgi:hypothetical protein
MPARREIWWLRVAGKFYRAVIIRVEVDYILAVEAWMFRVGRAGAHGGQGGRCAAGRRSQRDVPAEQTLLVGIRQFPANGPFPHVDQLEGLLSVRAGAPVLNTELATSGCSLAGVVGTLNDGPVLQSTTAELVRPSAQSTDE